MFGEKKKQQLRTDNLKPKKFLIFMFTGFFLSVFPGKAGSQLESINNSPCGLFLQCACSQGAATGTQQFTLYFWTQVPV